MIDSVTDIKIFIEYNKSANMVVGKEKFIPYKGAIPSKIGANTTTSGAKAYVVESGTGFASLSKATTQ